MNIQLITRPRLQILICVLLVLFPVPTTTADQPPNVVFIYVDDLGFSDVGFNGSRHFQTPDIDRLASEGMKFTNAYANAPNCAPSRACLMSGQYSPRHRIFTVGNSARGESKLRKLVPTTNETTLSKDFVTMAEMFQSAGYETGFFGKWHLGEPGKSGPLEQGFDVNVGGNHTGHPAAGYFAPYRNPQIPDPVDASNANEIQNAAEPEYLTDRLTDEAIQFMRANAEKPFFIFLAHYAVHTPIQAKSAETELFRHAARRDGFNAKYAAMIFSVDQSVQKVTSEIEALSLGKKTLVVFYSDNGGNGNVTDNSPLRGSKGMLYEGGIRVPLAIRWIGAIPADSVCDEPVSGVDFYETFRVMLGAAVSPHQPLDGVDLMPLLTARQKTLDRGPLFWHFPAYLEGRNARGAADDQFRTRPCGAIRDKDWKMIEYFEDGRQELYNLADDVGETNNLADQHPEIRQRLADRLHLWQKKLAAPVPVERNPEFSPGSPPDHLSK